jgi:hypothetical protein
MPGTKNSGGRNKKPTQLHVLRGTFRKHRHVDHETPAPPPGTPTPPKRLTGDAKREWTRMLERLAEASVPTTRIDDAWLYQYVQLFAETEAILTDNAQLRQLQAQVKKSLQKLSGRELVSAIAEVVKIEQILTKQVTQLRQGHLAIRQYLVESGMTPAARSRVKLPAPLGPEPESKLGAFIRRVH